MKDETEHEAIDEHREDKTSHFLAFMFGLLIISTFSRQITIKFSTVFPYHNILITLGLLFSFVFPEQSDPLYIKSKFSVIFVFLNAPVTIFQCAYEMEADYLGLAIYHVCLVCLPSLLVTSTVVIAFGLSYFPFEFEIYSYMAVVAISIIPGTLLSVYVISLFDSPKDLKMLLRAEVLFTEVLALQILKVVLEPQFENQHVFAAGLAMFFGPLLGFIIGKLLTICLKDIFEDDVNHTTVIITTMFITYTIGELINVSGIAAVTVLGILVANKKASMTRTAQQSLKNFIEIFTLLFSGIANTCAGIFFGHHVLASLTIKEFGVHVGMFIIVTGTRLFMLVCLYPIYSKFYCKEFTSVFIMTFSNLKGTFSFFLCFTLLDIESHLPKKTFEVALIQTILAVFVSGPLLHVVTLFCGYFTFKKEKVITIKKAAKIIHELKMLTIASMKNTAFTTDADWDIVNKQTKLKPRFMRMYQYSAYMTKALEAEKKLGRVVKKGGDEVRSHAIRQTVLSNKACFNRLYQEGILGVESVINLMLVIEHSLKVKTLINPNSITKLSRIQKIMYSLEESLLANDTFKENNWYLILLFNAMALFDFWITIYTANTIIFDPENSNKRTLIGNYNIVILLGLVLFSLLKIKNYRKLKTSPGILDKLGYIIVIYTIAEQCFSVYPMVVKYIIEQQSFSLFGDKNKWMPEVFVLFLVLTRILRITYIAILINPIIQKCLISWVENANSKISFILADSCWSFIYAMADSIHKIKEIDDGGQIHNNLRQICHKSKLSLLQHFCLLQAGHTDVICALKTRIAIRTVLNAQKKKLDEIKLMGLLGGSDSYLLLKEIEKSMWVARKFPNTLPIIDDKTVIANIAWIDNNEEIMNFFEKKGKMIRFLPNDVLITQGYMPKGIFIILSGIVRVECDVDREKESGLTKNTCHYSKRFKSDKLEKKTIKLLDFFTTGHVLGEVSILTGKPGHKTFKCATCVEALFLSYKNMITLLEGTPAPDKPMGSLEKKIWRSVAIRQAVRLIHHDGGNHSLSRMFIHDRMANSYILDGNSVPVVSVQPDKISSIVLVQGFIKEYSKNIEKAGPCIIPDYMTRLMPLPHKGERVVFLIIEKALSEINEEQNFMDMVIQDFYDEQGVEEDEVMTISSASSDAGPYRRPRKTLKWVENKSAMMIPFKKISTGKSNPFVSLLAKRFSFKSRDSSKTETITTADEQKTVAFKDQTKSTSYFNFY